MVNFLTQARARYFFLPVILLLGACSDSNTKPSELVVSLVEGIWSAPAYGKIYQFSKANNAYISSLYYVTENTCLLGTEQPNLSAGDLENISRLTDSLDEIEIHNLGEALSPGVIYEKLESLPERCLDSKLAVKGQPGYSFDPNRDFQIFWDAFNERYIDFDLSGTDWQAIYSEAELFLPEVESEADLFELFSQMIAPLQDGHTSVIQGDLSGGIFALLDSDIEYEEFTTSNKPDYVDSILEEYVSINGLTQPLTDEELTQFEVYLETQEQRTEDAISSYAISPDQTAADDQFIWFQVAADVGYLYIGSMAGYADSDFDIGTDVSIAQRALDQIVSDAQDLGGLIIDLRFNEGGHDEISLAIAQYFIANTSHAFSKQAKSGNGRTRLQDVFIDPAEGGQYLGQVVLLTSTTTASAAEVFALILRSFSNVTIVGEPTEGKFSNELESRVTSDIAFGLSNEFYYSPAGEWFERAGIPVDHTVAFSTLEQRDQNRDYGIEKALELLAQ